MPRRHALLLALVLCVPLGAQVSEPIGSDDPAPPALSTLPTAALLQRLKARTVDVDTAAAIVAELASRPTRDRLQAATTLRASYVRRKKDYDRDAARALERCERVAGKLQKQRLGRDGSARVEELRAAALGVTRAQNLSKAAIHQEIDPRVDELTKLLLPAKHELIEDDAALADALQHLRDQHAELSAWFEAYRGALRGLELHPDAEKHLARHPAPPAPGDASSIDAMIALAAFTGLPMAEQDRKALQANEALRGATNPEELDGTLQLNRLRYLLGLSLLRIDPKLGDAARDHSKDMHTLGFFSHTSPVAGKERFGQRAANHGTSASAENIAAGHRTGEGAIRAWWYSPGHHKNMLGNHRRTGLGQHESLWTQLFGG